VQAGRAGPPQTAEAAEEDPGTAAEPGQIQEQTPGDRHGGAQRMPAAMAATEGEGS